VGIEIWIGTGSGMTGHGLGSGALRWEVVGSLGYSTGEQVEI
jgi:hypothetical protein